MRSRTLACALLVAGCGRFGFGSSGDDTGDATASGDADGASDAMPDALAAECATTHPTALFCDGFENLTTPPMPPWNYAVITDAVAQRATTRAYRGLAALESITAVSTNIKYARWGHFLPAPVTSGELYLRSFQYLASTSVIDDQVSVLLSGNGQPPYPATFVLLTPTQIWLQVNGTSFMFNAAFPTDRWVCVQLHIHVDPTAGTVDLKLDSGNALTAGTTNTLVAGGYTNVEAGVHYAGSNQSPVSMWTDEYVVDTQPIGCN